MNRIDKSDVSNGTVLNVVFNLQPPGENIFINFWSPPAPPPPKKEKIFTFIMICL